MKELCEHCRPLGYCEFEKEANKIARLARLKEIEPIHASENITELRVFARNERLCPRINDVNPLVPGL